MQPNFLFKRLLQKRLTIVIRYYMVYLQNVIKQLQRVQNVAACVVTLSPKFCHITPVLGNLHWLPIDLWNGIEFKILTVTYKTLHGLARTYIKDFLQCCLPAGDLMSSKKNLLAVRAFNITVMAVVLFLLLPRFFGLVFLSILGMLDHWTFLKDS